LSKVLATAALGAGQFTYTLDLPVLLTISLVGSPNSSDWDITI
jgi:hypothetical protein